MGVATAMFGTNTNQIETNEDCNNLTTPGAYKAVSASVATSLSHRPFALAFVLWYISPYLSKNSWQTYGIQIAFSQSGIKYRCQVEGSWGSWITVTST